jgi:hypothetical protein
MVEGLDKFANHFESYTDNYMLIGGTARTGGYPPPAEVVSALWA